MLIGKESGDYFDLISPTELAPISALSVCTEHGGVDDDNEMEMKKNNTIFSSPTSQALSVKDVEKMKQDSTLSSKDLITSLVENNGSFEHKNSFSQLKYLKRKEKKYLRWFSIKLPNARLLLSYYTGRGDSRKILNLRMDSVSQITSQGNMGAGSTFLVWDDTNGFLTGTILAGTRGCAASWVINCHPGRQMQTSNLSYWNLDSEKDRFLNFQLSALQFLQNEDIAADGAGEFIIDPTIPHQQSMKQKERFEYRQHRKTALKLLLSAKVPSIDTLFIATDKHDPFEILKALQSLLKYSGRVVIYSPYREFLTKLNHSLRTNPSMQASWTDISFTESFLRPYQTASGRLHPMMVCDGHTGPILSFTKVGACITKQ